MSNCAESDACISAMYISQEKNTSAPRNWSLTTLCKIVPVLQDLFLHVFVVVESYRTLESDGHPGSIPRASGYV